MKQINPNTMANLLVCMLSMYNPISRITNFISNVVKRIPSLEYNIMNFD